MITAHWLIFRTISGQLNAFAFFSTGISFKSAMLPLQPDHELPGVGQFYSQTIEMPAIAVFQD